MLMVVAYDATLRTHPQHQANDQDGSTSAVPYTFIAARVLIRDTLCLQ